MAEKPTPNQKPAKYVLVEAIQQHRMRYVVELDEDAPAEWALDTVTMREAKEFSQLDLGETIVSHRVLSGLDEAVSIARADEPNVAGRWNDETIIRARITRREDYKKG